MGGLALFFFLVLPVAELIVAFQIAGAIGAFATVMLLLGGSVIGGYVVRRAGAKAWGELQRAATSGRPPRDVVDGAIVLLGGLLLLVPGFITDVFGIVLLIPWTRRGTRWAVATYVMRRVKIVAPLRRARDRSPYDRDDSGAVNQGDVIEGEVVEETDEPYGSGKRDRPDQIGRAG
jgi:UPF0716 protein FxsA